MKKQKVTGTEFALSLLDAYKHFQEEYPNEEEAERINEQVKYIAKQRTIKAKKEALYEAILYWNWHVENDEDKRYAEKKVRDTFF